MNNLQYIARLLIVMGFFILLAGGFMLLLAKIGAAGLKLPGDIYIKKGNFSFYFPVVTCIVISLILTVILNLTGRR